MATPDYIQDTDSAIKYCNEKINFIDKLLSETEELSEQIKLLQAQTYWVERLDSMMRLADKQGKGVHQLTDAISSNKPRKLLKNIRPLKDASKSTEPTDSSS